MTVVREVNKTEIESILNSFTEKVTFSGVNPLAKSLKDKARY